MSHLTELRHPNRTAHHGSVKLTCFALLVVLAIVASGCGAFGSSIAGSGEATTQQYPGDEFTTVEIGDDLEVDLQIRPDGDPLIEITIDDNLHEHLTAEVSNGRLVVTSDNIAPTATIHIEVQGYLVTGLIANADVDVSATLPAASSNKIELADNARLTVAVDTDTLDIQADHDAELELSGRAAQARITINNDAIVRLDQATVIDATIDARNDAIVEINASGTITGTARSDATIRIGGSATVQVDTSDDAIIQALG